MTCAWELESCNTYCNHQSVLLCPLSVSGETSVRKYAQLKFVHVVKPQ